MAYLGQEIQNPVTGERIIFRQTARETDGELLRMEYFMRPGGFVASAHIHAAQEERWQIISGTRQFRVGKDEFTAGGGGTVLAPAGAAHIFWNHGNQELHAIIELRPAFDMEGVFEAFFGLAQDGKTHPKTGKLSFLQAVLLVQGCELYADQPPVWVQKATLPILRPIAKLLGYRARYPQYTSLR